MFKRHISKELSCSFGLEPRCRFYCLHEDVLYHLLIPILPCASIVWIERAHESTQLEHSTRCSAMTLMGGACELLQSTQDHCHRNMPRWKRSPSIEQRVAALSWSSTNSSHEYHIYDAHKAAKHSNWSRIERVHTDHGLIHASWGLILRQNATRC